MSDPNMMKNADKVEVFRLAIQCLGIVTAAFFFVRAIQSIEDNYFSSLAYGCLTFVIVQLLSAILIRFDQKNEHNELVTLVKGSNDVFYIGDSMAGLGYVLAKLKKARSVKNTNISPEGHKYPEKLQNFLAESFEKFFDDYDKTWFEVASDKDHEHIKKRQEIYKKISLAPNIDVKGKFEARILKHSIPCVNFVILDYGNNKREVLFGFHGYSTIETGTVMASQNPLIVSYFDSIFSELKVSSEIVNL